MTFETFDELNNEVVALFQQEAYEQALALLDRYRGHFPADRALLDYFRACAAARLSRPGQAIQILDDCLKAGLWFGQEVLRGSPSFAPLQELPAFLSLVADSKELEEASQEPSHLLVLAPAGANSPLPLLFALHGNGSSANKEFSSWGQAAELGYLVTAPESKHVTWVHGRAWLDHESAAEDILPYLANLSGQYDPGRVVLAGFSMGAEVATWLALTGRVAAKGFIAVGPGGPFMDNLTEWLPLLTASKSGLRGCIIYNQDDKLISAEACQQFAALLNEHGQPCLLIVCPDSGHQLPAGMLEKLAQALTFIFDQ